MKRKCIKNGRFTIFLVILYSIILLTVTSTTTLAQALNTIPPIAEANGPFTVLDPNTGEPYPFGFYVEFEGSTVIFDSTGSYDPDGGPILYYHWSFFGAEGPPWIEQFYLTGPTPSMTWDDPYASLINLRVFDDEYFAGDQQSFGDDLAYVVILDVILDIKPGNYPNSINPESKGVIPVAIFNENYFDPTLINPEMITFGPSGVEAQPIHFNYEDLDDDGDTDLILHFKTQETGFQQGDTTGILIAYLYDGRRIHAEDDINIVPPKIK